jgi:hypothetical protein
MKYQLWDQTETAQLLRHMETHGRDWATIGRLMKRTERSCEHRWRWVNMTDDERKGRSNASEAARRARKDITRVVKRFRDDAVYPVVAPVEIFEDRERRLSTPRTLTGRFFGDPPPGYSALDRKRQGLPV